PAGLDRSTARDPDPARLSGASNPSAGLPLGARPGGHPVSAPVPWNVHWRRRTATLRPRVSWAEQPLCTRQMCLMATRCTVQAPVLTPPEIRTADDEILLRESLQDALEQAGYRVALARHGLEALAMLDRLARPALVVLDLQMPVMDGVQFLDEIRKR